MDENTLRQLLTQADEALPAAVPPEPHALATLVRRRAQRSRQIHQLVAISAAALLIAAVSVALSLWAAPDTPAPQQPPEQLAQADPSPISPELTPAPPPPEQAAEPAELAQTVRLTRAEMMQLRSEIAALRAEAEVRQQIIDAMLLRQAQQKRLAVLKKKLATYRDPITEARGLREETAAISLYWTDTRAKQDELTPAVAQEYRRIIDLFPETQAAEQARRYLSTPQQQTQGEIL